MDERRRENYLTETGHARNLNLEACGDREDWHLDIKE